MCIQKAIENWCYHLTGVKILETAIFHFTLLIAFDYFVLQMQKQRQVDLWRLLQSKVVLKLFFFFKWSIKDSINFPLVRKLTRLPVLIELDETLDLGFAACPHALGYPPSIMVEFKTNWLVLFFPPDFRDEEKRIDAVRWAVHIHLSLRLQLQGLCYIISIIDLNFSVSSPFFSLLDKHRCLLLILLLFLFHTYLAIPESKSVESKALIFHNFLVFVVPVHNPLF